MEYVRLSPHFGLRDTDKGKGSGGRLMDSYTVSINTLRLCDPDQISLTSLCLSDLTCKTGVKKHLLKRLWRLHFTCSWLALCMWELRLWWCHCHCCYSSARIPSCPSGHSLDAKSISRPFKPNLGVLMLTLIMALVTLFMCLCPHCIRMLVWIFFNVESHVHCLTFVVRIKEYIALLDFPIRGISMWQFKHFLSWQRQRTVRWRDYVHT